MKKNKTVWRGIRLCFPLYPKFVLVMCGAAVLLRVALPFLGIWLPRVVLDGITSGLARDTFLLRVGGLALLLAAVNYFKSYSDSIVNDGTGTTGISRVFLLEFRKYMSMDYDLMEDAGFKAADDKMQRAIDTNHALSMNIPKILTELLSSALGFLLYAGVIAAVHPWMLPVLAVTAAVNWCMLSRVRKYDEATKEARGKIFRRLRALRESVGDPAAAKDLRLYRAADWVRGVYRAEYAGHLAAEGKVRTKTMHVHLVDALMLLVRDGLAYALLVGLVLDGRLTPGGFVFAFAAVGGLAGWITGTLTAASELNRATAALCDVFDAIEYPDRMNTGAGAPLPTGDALPPAITLRGVGYTYPNAEAPALRDVSVEVKPGERIAIVGTNGAGKTTLVKLLCSLCTPTEGEILVNGLPVGAYSRDAYYTLLAAVFQDIHLLAATVAANVAQTSEWDECRVRECLALAGLELDPEALLVRAVHPAALELSGGQKQKLALARALYKNAPILLLDEPTAALDPIAEREVYERYAALTEGKTSFYISHRLASTRFCDRILLIDGGVIAEAGTHDALMALGGKYAELFNLQAGYYREAAI